MHTLLKALSDLGRDLKIRGKTQALHSLCEDCADPTEFSAHINSCTCQQWNMTQATVSWSHLSLVPPAQWCLWHSLICNWLGSSCAFFCHRISWSYPPVISWKQEGDSAWCQMHFCMLLFSAFSQAVSWKKKNNPALGKFRKLQTKDNIGSRSLNST